MQALAAFRASQLRFLAPYTTQLRPIASSRWPFNNTDGSSPSTPPSPQPPRQSSSSLVPIANRPRSLFPSLTEIVASAIHRLVLLVTSLNRASANEIYVRRVLQQQLGIHPLELDLLSLHHPEVFRLSVRHSIEPVVGYLRSQGLTGSALVHVISRAPGILSSSVEEHVMPLCNFLKEILGSRGMGALVRYPQIVETSPVVLQNGFEILKNVGGASEEECTFFLREYPELFVRYSTLIEEYTMSNGEELDIGVHAAQMGGPGEEEEEDESDTRIVAVGSSEQQTFKEQVEQVLFYFRALKTVSSSGWDVKIAETELRNLLEVFENRNKQINIT